MDYNNLSDEKLAYLAQDKDSEAMQCLIERYKSTVASFSRYYFLSGGDVEDLIQEGMIGVFKAIETFNGKVEFKHYVFKCIKNSIFTAIRRYKNGKAIPLDNYISLSAYFDGEVDKTEFLADNKLEPEQFVINKESEQELNKRLDECLTDFEREVLSLYLHGYSYKVIAEKVGKPVKFIDNNLQKIKKKLTITLKQKG